MNRYNIPSILSAAALSGVVITAGLAIHDTLEASDDIKNHERMPVIMKHYIPTVISTLFTSGFIIGAESLNRSQKAALISSLGGVGLLTAGSKEIRDRMHILKENNTDYIWVFEDFRRESNEENAGWFQTTLMDLFAAEYDINHILVTNDGDPVYLNDFYFYLNADYPRTALGDVYYWSTEFCKWIEFQHQKVIRNDGFEYYILTYAVEPRPDYEECH